MLTRHRCVACWHEAILPGRPAQAGTLLPAAWQIARKSWPSTPRHQSSRRRYPAGANNSCALSGFTLPPYSSGTSAAAAPFAPDAHAGKRGPPAPAPAGALARADCPDRLVGDDDASPRLASTASPARRPAACRPPARVAPASRSSSVSPTQTIGVKPASSARCVFTATSSVLS